MVTTKVQQELKSDGPSGSQNLQTKPACIGNNYDEENKLLLLEFLLLATRIYISKSLSVLPMFNEFE